jgi:outer membrane receptor protein involved in Fe transport
MFFLAAAAPLCLQISQASAQPIAEGEAQAAPVNEVPVVAPVTTTTTTTTTTAAPVTTTTTTTTTTTGAPTAVSIPGTPAMVLLPAATAASAAPAATSSPAATASQSRLDPAPQASELLRLSAPEESARRVTARPTTTLTRSDLLASGLINLGMVVQRIASQGNAINEQANNGGDGTTRISLRGLGTSRTLVLVNGHRVGPGGTGADRSTDLSVIPMAMVERIEVLKDGDGASFGSGAIGGVVNVVTRKRFDGAEASLYAGSSSRDDGARHDASMVTGVTSSNGHITIGASFLSQESVFARDREFSSFDKAFDYGTREVSNIGSTAIPSGRINTRVLDTNGDGRPDAPVNLCGLTAEGVPIQFCRRQGAAFVPFVFPQDLYNYQPENYLITPSQRFAVVANAERKISDDVNAFIDTSFTHSETEQRLAPEPFSSVAPISALSVYNPLGLGVLGYNRRLVEFGPRSSAQEIDTFRLVAGFQGELERGLGDTWKWELSYNLSRSGASQRNAGNVNIMRITNALGPSFFDPNGVARCGTPAAVIDGCVPLNILAGADANAMTEDMIAYSRHDGVSTGTNQEQTILAKLSGNLMSLPGGGGLSFLATADHRRESGRFTPDSLTAAGGTTGNVVAPVEGEQSVSEAHAEVTLAPAVNPDGTKLIELSAAARAFRYDTIGSGTAWRASAIVRPSRGLAARASISHTYRAPSISELFVGTANSFPQVVDPCDTLPPSAPEPIVLPPDVAARCAAQGVPRDAAFGTSQQRAIIGGNPNVKQETAKVLSIGAVLEPAPGLALSADFFHTIVEDSIQSLGAAVILANCYNRGLSEFCDKVHRDPNAGGQIDFIDNIITNGGGNDTSGVDVALAYEHDRGKSHFRHLVDATYLINFDIDNTLQTLRAKGNYDFGVYPEWKVNATSQWDYENYGFGANLRFFSGFDECQDSDCNSLDQGETSGAVTGAAVSSSSGSSSASAAAAVEDELRRDVDSNLTIDVFGNYTFGRGSHTKLTVGVNNVFDQDPPPIYSGFHGDSDSSSYDYMGRFFYARLTQQF